MSLLHQLNQHDQLSKTARFVAIKILEDPQAAVSLPIAELARRAKVSEPTVNRLCRALGCKGYPDFKVKLAGELASGRGKISRTINFDDNLSEVVSKVFDSTHASLTMAQNVCDISSITAAVTALTDARAIYFFGHGASGSVAIDAQHKFMRFKKPVVAHVDALNQRIAATNLNQEDVAVFISYTGRTRIIIEAAELAVKSGAHILGLTSQGSPLAQHCLQVLEVGNDEDTDTYTPMTSRIAQLSLIDILVAGTALKMGNEFSSHLLDVKRSVANTKTTKKN